MSYREPVAHLFLDDGPVGDHTYHVVLPVRVAEEIGLRCVCGYCDGVDTFRQFLELIETRGKFANFEVSCEATKEESSEPPWYTEVVTRLLLDVDRKTSTVSLHVHTDSGDPYVIQDLPQMAWELACRRHSNNIDAALQDMLARCEKMHLSAPCAECGDKLACLMDERIRDDGEAEYVLLCRDCAGPDHPANIWWAEVEREWAAGEMETTVLDAESIVRQATESDDD